MADTEKSDIGGSPAPLIPAAIMKQVDEACIENLLVGLEMVGPDNMEMRPVLQEAAAQRLAVGCDETELYFGVSCLGNTGSGKSFLLKKLLEKLESTDLPFSLDYSDVDGGYCTVSTTGGVHCFRKGNRLFFDVEGTGGILPLVERIRMGIKDRMRISTEEARIQQIRKECVEKYFPPLAYVTSNVVVFVTREPLNCDASSEAITKFTAACVKDTGGVRPALIIVHNFCPLNHMRLGDEAQARFTNEYLATFDAMGLLSNAFSKVMCMTFPDCDAYDKRKKLDGDEVFNQQLDRLGRMIQEQNEVQNEVRRRTMCALSPHALFKIMPELIKQLQECKMVSVPEILTVQMKNNPDPDCLLLRGIFNGIVEVLAKTWKEIGEAKYGTLVSCAMRLAFAVSARYLMYKFRREGKISFPDEWIKTQTDHLYEKLKQYFVCVFCTCNAEYPDSPEGKPPIRCLQKYVGHETHLTSVPVIPQRYNFLHRGILQLFGGVRDRWEGDFVLHPVMEDLLGGQLQEVMRSHALEAATALRIRVLGEEEQNAVGEGIAAASAAASGDVNFINTPFFDNFRDQGMKYVFECVDQLGREHLHVSRRMETEDSQNHPFCVTCYQPVRGESQCLVMCQLCKEIRDKSLAAARGS